MALRARLNAAHMKPEYVGAEACEWCWHQVKGGIFRKDWSYYDPYAREQLHFCTRKCRDFFAQQITADGRYDGNGGTPDGCIWL